MPQIGLYVPANDYPLPSFSVPPSLDLTVPLLGLAEISTKVQSNFYSWEGSVVGGNDTANDAPSYVAHFKSVAESPLNLLSYRLEGKRPGFLSTSSSELQWYLFKLLKPL